jgi:hypothetical protein
MSEEESPPTFELYKLLVEMADRISARRGTANGFFLTLHTGLAAFAGLAISRPVGPLHADRFGLTLTGAAGLILCAAWWLLLRSYRLLNTAKFEVINELEKRFEFQPFSREWEKLKQEDPVSKKKPRYAELSVVERFVPVAFAAAYAALIWRAGW